MSPAEREETITRWTHAVRQAGVKLTHQRLEIIRALAGNPDHPDAETLLRAVRERTPSVSLDTVYRTLWLLHELGFITTLSARREGLRFDTKLERHHHFVCMQCGLVRDFESEALNALPLPESVLRLGGVLDARVEVRGLCAACQTKAPSDNSATTQGEPNDV